MEEEAESEPYQQLRSTLESVFWKPVDDKIGDVEDEIDNLEDPLKRARRKLTEEIAPLCQESIQAHNETYDLLENTSELLKSSDGQPQLEIIRAELEELTERTETLKKALQSDLGEQSEKLGRLEDLVNEVQGNLKRKVEKVGADEAGDIEDLLERSEDASRERHDRIETQTEMLAGKVENLASEQKRQRWLFAGLYATLILLAVGFALSFA